MIFFITTAVKTINPTYPVVGICRLEESRTDEKFLKYHHGMA
jgi:hypothetical protein